MGNRAFITDRKKEMGIYLHWNGGRDSVEAFLKYCELKGYRYPETDGYGWARLAQVIGNFFGGGLSIGIEPRVYDPGDNGIYDNYGIFYIFSKFPYLKCVFTFF